MANRVLLCLAHMSGREQQYVTEAFDTNWVVPLGPNVDAFEQDLRSFVESAPDTAMQERDGLTLWPRAEWAEQTPKEVVALSAGTAAVHLALVALGVGPGDEVICQSFTFCASCNPIVYLGATPVLVDSEAQTWNMSPALLERAILDRKARTGRTPRAIVVVHLYGMPAQMDALLEVASRYDIPVVEDAAEALGSRYRGRVCGTLGSYGVLSFNGNKMITTSGGGALVVPDIAAKRRLMFYATQARESYPYYQHEEIGYNYRMSNICAGIGRGQMTVLDAHIAHHRRLAALYAEAFAEVEGITYHGNPGAEYDANFWLSTITVSPELRIRGQQRAYATAVSGAVGGAAGVTHAAATVETDCQPNDNVEALRLVLDEAGIESRPLWKPMHRQPVYRDVPAYVDGTSDRLFATGLCLPSGPHVSEEDVRRVVDIIRGAIL